MRSNRPGEECTDNIPDRFGTYFGGDIFTGVYAVSEAALNSNGILANEASGLSFGQYSLMPERPDSSAPLGYQNVAIFICPSH